MINEPVSIICYSLNRASKARVVRVRLCVCVLICFGWFFVVVVHSLSHLSFSSASFCASCKLMLAWKLQLVRTKFHFKNETKPNIWTSISINEPLWWYKKMFDCESKKQPKPSSDHWSPTTNATLGHWNYSNICNCTATLNQRIFHRCYSYSFILDYIIPQLLIRNSIHKWSYSLCTYNNFVHGF